MTGIVVVYTTQTEGFVKGREFCYQNPEYFDSVIKEAVRVVVVGDWPNVVSTYQNLGVPVVFADKFDADAHGLDANDVPVPAAPEAPVVPPVSADDVKIPDEWEKMPWVSEDPEGSIRTLAMKFTTEPVINRGQAQRIVREVIARRNGTPASE